MMKKILLMLSLMVIGLFLAGCASVEEKQAAGDLTDAEKAQLPSDMKEGETALAGQAVNFGSCVDPDSATTFDKNSLATKSKTTYASGSFEDKCYTWNAGTPQEKTRLIEGTCSPTRSGSKFLYWYADCSEEKKCVDGECQSKSLDFEYLLNEITIYTTFVKIGGVAYLFSFDFDTQILTFKYWGNGETNELLMKKELGNYVANFEVGGVAYPVKIDFGEQPPVITLVGWPGTEGSIEHLLNQKKFYNAKVKIGGVAYPFLFDFDTQILTFKYWGNGETNELLMKKELDNYVANFEVEGVAYPVKIDWSEKPPIMTLAGWPEK